MQLNRYLDWAVRAGLYLILFAPLVVSQQMFFPFITGKNFLFRIVVEIIFALWLILTLRDKSYRPRRSWLLIFVTAAVFVLALSAVFGVDPSRSFWSNFERMEGLLGHLHLLAYFFVLVGVLRSEKDWWRFFHVSFFVSLLVSVYALFQLGGYFEIHQGGVRVDSTLGNATYLAVYLLFHLFLLLYYFLKTQKPSWRTGYALLFLVEAFILYETATRGAILGFIGGLFLFALLFGFLSSERRFRFFALGVFGLILLSLLGFYLIRDSQFVKESPTLARLRNISLEDDTTKARFYIWQMSFEAFKERPILGWGQENFTVVFSKYFDPRLWKQEPWFDRAHNAVFDWLIAGGILGLLAYLGIFASALILLFKSFRQKKISNLELSVFAGLSAAYLFQNLFVFDQLASYLMLFGVLAFIHSLSVSNSNVPRSDLPGRSDLSGEPVWFAGIIAALIVSLYFFNAKPLLANFSLLSAIKQASEGEYQESQSAFRRALSLSPLGRREAREQYAHFASLIARREDIPEILRLQSLNEAIRETKLQTEASPLDARNFLFLGSIYNAAGQRSQALDAFEKALELSPRKQQTIFLLAQFYLDNQEFERALELAAYGARLDPTYSDAQHNLITLAIRAGREDLAEEGIKNLQKTNSASAANLKTWASLWAGEGKYEMSARLYQEALTTAPGDIQLRISLAATYYELGRKDLAIAEIQKAIELEPNFRPQGEFFINEIRAGRRPQ